MIDPFDRWIKTLSMKRSHDCQFLLMKVSPIIKQIQLPSNTDRFLLSFNWNSSFRTRRQPNLAYSTRRKDLSGISMNQSLLNTTSTPSTNKRKLAVSTPMNKLIKRLFALCFEYSKNLFGFFSGRTWFSARFNSIKRRK